MTNGAAERSANISHAKDLAAGAGQNDPLNAKGNFERRPHLSAITGELRAFARGKPLAVRVAAINVLCCLKAIGSGGGTTATYAALAEKIEQIGRK